MSRSGPGAVVPLVVANVLDGYVRVQVAGTSTLITVPAGRTWVGQVGAAASAQNPLNVATGSLVVEVGTAGVGVTPAAGPYAGVSVELPATAATATVGVSAAESLAGQRLVVVAPAGNVVTVTATVTVGGVVTGFQASAWAVGELQ